VAEEEARLHDGRALEALEVKATGGIVVQAGWHYSAIPTHQLISSVAANLVSLSLPHTYRDTTAVCNMY